MIGKILMSLASAAIGAAVTKWHLEKDVVWFPQVLEPGDWFSVYAEDWMEAHNVQSGDDMTSGIVVGADSGDWIWVTNSPEWDAHWFAAHGMEFPEKWVPFAAIEEVDGEPGDYIRLPGL